MPNPKRSLTTKINNRRSKTSEDKFKAFVEALGGCAFRIEDGDLKTARRAQKTIRFRKPQVCDYIVAYKGQIGLFDIKAWEKKKPSLSHFYNATGRAKPSSTQKQYSNFLKLDGHGFRYTGFVFFKYNFDLMQSFYFLSTLDIIKRDFSPKKIDKLDSLFAI